MALGVKTGGRKKGTPNKFTASVKEAIEGAFSAVGGETYLTKVARDDPRTFCTLLAKVLPNMNETALNLTVSSEVGAIIGAAVSGEDGDDNHEPDA